MSDANSVSEKDAASSSGRAKRTLAFAWRTRPTRVIVLARRGGKRSATSGGNARGMLEGE
eukprot:2896932-Alexandrium_andersonii.AAC.1